MMCEGMDKGGKAKMEVLAELLKQMKALMGKGHGDKPMMASEGESAEEELGEDIAESIMGEDEPSEGMPVAPKKKKVTMMVVASGKKAPSMKAKKAYG